MIELTERNFREEVLNATELVLVDFWGAWCRPCHLLATILESVANKAPDIKIGKVNVDENPALMAEYQINALPTLIFFKEGKICNRLVGLQNESTLLNNLETMRG